jgi:hypothetical protein
MRLTILALIAPLAIYVASVAAHFITTAFAKYEAALHQGMSS